MVLDEIEFSAFEKNPKLTSSFQNFLAPEIGKVYVVAITRDECPACRRQKPKFARLAAATTQKHGGKVVFIRIHVKYSERFKDESLRSKDLFGHYFYPTNLILLRTWDRGAVELYRNASPRISELEKSVETALEIASMIEKETH